MRFWVRVRAEGLEKKETWDALARKNLMEYWGDSLEYLVTFMRNKVEQGGRSLWPSPWQDCSSCCGTQARRAVWIGHRS